MTGHAPECLTSQFITKGHVYRRVTRNFQQLNIPLFKTATGQKTFYYSGVSIWKNMNSRLKLCKTTHHFQENSKTISLK